ncbi:MAG: hypothetical protein ACPGVI_07150, partial [Crocinitomicaceae bacterium]
MKFLTRLLIYSSFIFYSCNETSEVGIDEILINQKEKIKVHYPKIEFIESTDKEKMYTLLAEEKVFGLIT